MKVFLIIICLLFATISFSQVIPGNEKTNRIKTSVQSEIPIYNFKEFESLLVTNSDKVHIVNFWAMWCAPCVKELPLFQEFSSINPDAEIILVSLDFPEDIETKLKPFLIQKGISLNVVLLDDSDSNSWINKVYPNWSGAIPFTILFNNKHRAFYERAFHDIHDLEAEINKTIKNN